MRREAGEGMNKILSLTRRIDVTQESAFARDARRGAAARVFTNFRLVQALAFLFVAPNAIFALSLAPLPAAVLLAGCAGALFVVLRAAPRGGALAATIDWKRLTACVLLAFALCIVGGQGHFFYSAADWLIRDSLVADMAAHGYPIVYSWQEHDYLLRAPLGMYVVPATIGRFFGLSVGHLVLLAQNGAVLSIVLYFLAQMLEVRLVVALPLFVLFSGLDIVGVLGHEVRFWFESGALPSFGHLEWWNGVLQYSSHVTQLFWVPNHALPGWCFAALALLYARGEVALDVLMPFFAAMLFWSPLAMLGALPFLVYFVLAALPGALGDRRLWVAAGVGLLFLPVAIYLTLDAGEVRHGFLGDRPNFWFLYVAFLAIEVPHFAVIAAAWNKVDARDKRLLYLSAAILAVLPLYEFGPANDIAMRASIPALFFVAFTFARIAAQTPRDGSRLATAISAIVLIGAATPIIELRAAFNGAYAVSDCNFLTAWNKASPAAWPSNYLSRVERTPFWLLDPGAERLRIETRQCWPDHPVLEDARK
jgi:hypothetical protein